VRQAPLPCRLQQGKSRELVSLRQQRVSMEEVSLRQQPAELHQLPAESRLRQAQEHSRQALVVRPLEPQRAWHRLPDLRVHHSLRPAAIPYSSRERA
jgi:hypothetical protein